MKVFVSYSGREEQAVQVLVVDLERAGQDVWLDRDLRGGEAWWEAILTQIRDCDVFILALSDRSWRSKPCRAELDYARRLGKQVLGVQVGPVQSLRAMSIGDRQVIDYRDREAATALSLVAAVLGAAGRAQPLPDPLPDPPAIPFEYLLRLGRAVEAEHMSPMEQAGVLAQLKQGWEDEDDEGARHDIENLLRELRSRPDATNRTVTHIDDLLGTEVAAAVSETRAARPMAARAVAASSNTQAVRVGAGTPVPASAQIALGLWVLAFFLAFVGSVVPPWNLNFAPAGSAFAGIFTMVVMQTGRRWSRMLAVAAAELGAFFVIVGLFASGTWLYLGNSIAASISFVLSLLSMIGAVVFMFRPTSSAFMDDRRRRFAP